MILSGHQPAYLPWLGYFHKLALSDSFCIVDSVPYSGGDYINRNRIASANGTSWLTIPVQHPRRAQSIRDLRISGEGWRRKHRASLAQSYARAPYFKDYGAELVAVLEKRHTYLADFTTDVLRTLMRMLGLRTPLIRSSDYNVDGAKSGFVLNLSIACGADAFIFGAKGADYADPAAFRAAGVEPIFQEYAHPIYSQLRSPFIPQLSVVDLIFNEGPRSLKILQSGNVDRNSLRKWVPDGTETLRNAPARMNDRVAPAV